MLHYEQFFRILCNINNCLYNQLNEFPGDTMIIKFLRFVFVKLTAIRNF